MANPAIGEIRCPFTGEVSEVCRAKSGKFPMYYRNSQVGIIHGKASGFQNWLLGNATIFSPGQKKSEPEESHKVPGELPDDKKTGNDNAPDEKETGLLDWFFSDDEEDES
ncbi:hypothetical protein [Idiomarina sp.]|uniref:hypothetical protein n=1 Tax=Idiomarina sp. TaxID=1874361 RepID=UPI0025885E5D|nr:hypothetical protein [Idiomarina sp.]